MYVWYGRISDTHTAALLPDVAIKTQHIFTERWSQAEKKNFSDVVKKYGWSKGQSLYARNLIYIDMNLNAYTQIHILMISAPKPVWKDAENSIREAKNAN